MAAEGIEAINKRPDEVVAFFKAETARWGKVVRAAGIAAH
jgi:hypothetical protein